MKKNTQVVLAGALVLGLAAGGGTFALWSSNTTIDGGGVTTGKLAVSAGTISYTDASPDAATTTWNNDTDRMVPGDTVVSKQDLNVTLVGKNLTADLALTSGTPGASVADIAASLVGDFSVEFAVTPQGATPAASDWKAAAETVTLRSDLTPATADTAAYTVHVRYAFDADSDPAKTAAQAGEVAKLIAGTKVQLNQTR